MSVYREELINYCLRKLGAPVIRINLTPDQMNDCVDDALQEYTNFHYNGEERVWISHVITQQDIDQKYIKLDVLIKGVVRVLPMNYAGYNASNIQFSGRYQFMQDEIFKLNSNFGSVVSYELGMENIELIQAMFGTFPAVGFTSTQSKLKLATDWKNFEAGKTILVAEVLMAIDPEEVTKVYDESFVKKYTTALMKKQWGSNLKKFQNVPLPGGIMLDGKTIYDEAVEELNSIKEDMLTKMAPVSFFVG